MIAVWLMPDCLHASDLPLEMLLFSDRVRILSLVPDPLWPSEKFG